MPWLPKLIGSILGVVITSLLILADAHQLPNWHWPACNGLLIIPALYIAVAVHELGHLTAGTLVGLDTGGIAVGGIALIKSGKNWTFRFDRRISFCGFFSPLTRTADFRTSRYAWMVAGGPIASIALTALFGLTFVQHGSGAWEWIGTLFWASAFTALTSVLPFSSGLSKSDGEQLRLLILHPKQTCSWMALLALRTQEVEGVRPRDWDSRTFERLLAVNVAAGEYPYCQLMAFYRRIDEGSEAAAVEHLENALARSARAGKPFRHALYLETASASANIRKQAAQARGWWNRACKLRKSKSLDVIEAGIAMCEGRYDDAARHWEAARALADRKRLDSGLIRFAKEKWAEYEAFCRSAQA